MMAHTADTMTVSAGASGAIFGVVGGLLYVVTANRGQLEDLNTRQLVIMIFFSLYLGYTSTGVDNIAHLSGLVIGFVLAIILYHRPARDRWADGGIKR
jgi:rhomboid protease GluP